MTDQTTRAKQFAALHIKGDPVIIYNASDGGSARTIVSCGAKAIATGNHPVGVARISYRPVPQIAMTAWLKQQATAALNGEV